MTALDAHHLRLVDVVFLGREAQQGVGILHHRGIQVFLDHAIHGAAGKGDGRLLPQAARRLEQAAQRALELTGEGFGPTAAAKAAAQGTPYSKSEVYKQLLVLQQDRQTAE